MAICFAIGGLSSGRQQPVQHWYGCALVFNKVHAFHAEGEFRVVGFDDVSLLREIPDGELEVVAWEAHPPFDLGEIHLRITGVHAAAVVEDRKDRESTIEVTLNLIHEVDRGRHGILEGRLPHCPLRVVLRPFGGSERTV